MFHHFAEELGTADCLVRSTEFDYQEGPVASLLTGVTQSGYARQADGNYLLTRSTARCCSRVGLSSIQLMLAG